MARILASLLLAAAASAQSPPVDWKRHEPEILRHYRELLRIDTSSPPGNETKAVEYLKRVLESEGIGVKTFALRPDRANLVARLPGNGRKRPLLLMGHTDVVGVQREKWPVDPFGAVLREGYVWGRGAVDDKDNLAANLFVMLLLKRTGLPLERDVIFLAEAGEESTDDAVGIDFLVKNHFAEIDAEFALAEGGGGLIENGRVANITVATAEKVARRVKLAARGASGHGSVPRTDNALVQLAKAVANAGTWETPMRLNDTTRTYFERLAVASPPEKAARYNGLSDPARSAAIQRYLAEHEPRHYSMLRTSVVPTILKAGFRMNVIPSEAEATLDIRALPDEDMDKFYAELRRVVGNPAIRVEPITAGARPATPPSRLDTEMFRVLDAVTRRLYPGAVALPTMLTGGTDMAQLRVKGIQCYGIGPAALEDDTVNYGAHSDVERLPEASLYRFVEFTWNAVAEVARAR
jgi:acetylornithine deacetylase/succinyl-diaminopimelate desuccinylase-like protein